MELSALIEKVNQIFNITEVKELSDALMESLQSHDINKMQMFEELVGIESDNLRNIFQYYLADRNDKKQDFTPDSLCRLVKALANEDACFDMCAGSGALSVNFNKVTAYEYDEAVIPFLLFNYAIRNIEAEVWNMDVLSGEKFKVYKITKGERYGCISFESAI